MHNERRAPDLLGKARPVHFVWHEQRAILAHIDIEAALLRPVVGVSQALQVVDVLVRVACAGARSEVCFRAIPDEAQL